jgi:hypothetical protein
MNTFIGLSVAICAILAYSASGWLYPDAQGQHSGKNKTILCYISLCKRFSVTCGMSVVSSTNETDRHDITEILLKVALNTTTLILTSCKSFIKLKWLNWPHYQLSVK